METSQVPDARNSICPLLKESFSVEKSKNNMGTLSLYFLSLCMLLCGCVKFSKNEMKALKIISERYGCGIYIDKKNTIFITDINSPEEVHLQIEMTNIEMSKFHKTPDMGAIISAWLFLSTLGDAGDNISSLRVQYPFKSKMRNIEVDIEAIRLFCSFNPRLEDIDHIFKTENYEAIASMISPKILAESDMTKFLKELAELDSLHGTVEEQVITRIETVRPKTDTTLTWVRFHGNQKRGQKVLPFVINFDPYSGVTPIVGIHFTE